jgi:hyperosmotically inducible protein
MCPWFVCILLILRIGSLEFGLNLWHGTCLAIAANSLRIGSATKGEAMSIHMNLRRIGSALAALILATITFGASGASAATRSEGNNDAQLSEQVRHELAMLPWYGVFDNLAYTVNGGEVILTGQVFRPMTKSDAEKRVKRLLGVTRVENDITVLPPSMFDNQIRRAEFHAIFSDATLSRYALGPVPTIHIIVNRGHVTLEGVVGSKMDHDIANIRASGVPGVFSVTDNLRVG